MIEYVKVGGKQKYFGKSTQWNFGWNPIDSIDEKRRQAFLTSLVKFEIEGDDSPDVKEALLYKVVNKAAGCEFFPWSQKTGSCVGHGALAVMATLQAVEIVTQNQSYEEWKIPFIMFNYGQSRKRGGLHGVGEGSFGSSMAESCSQDGVPPIDTNLPQPIKEKDGSWTFGSNVEYKWSNGDAPPVDLFEVSNRFKVQTTSKLENSEEVKKALRNGYPVTIASGWWGFRDLKVQAKGTPAVQLASKSDSWGHQQACLGFTTHPDFGVIYLIQNSWGNAHGTPPGNYGEPLGSYWISEKDMNRICTEEVFAYSNFNGYPARVIDWTL
jgi:hypothetical protein